MKALNFEHPVGYKGSNGATITLNKRYGSPRCDKGSNGATITLNKRYGSPRCDKGSRGASAPRVVNIIKTIAPNRVRELGFKVYENLLKDIYINEFKWESDTNYVINLKTFKNSFNVYFSKLGYKNTFREKKDKALISRRVNDLLSKKLNYLIEVKENYTTKDGFYIRVIFN